MPQPLVDSLERSQGVVELQQEELAAARDRMEEMAAEIAEARGTCP